MATVSQAPATLNIVAVKGDDLTLTFTVTDTGAYSWTGATVATAILSNGTEQATDFTVSTPVDGTLILSLTDTNTTTLGTGVFQWWVAVTKAGATRTWLAGNLSILEPGQGGSSSSTAALSITTGAVTIDASGSISGPQGDWSLAQSINAQTGTTYTLVAGDLGKLVTLSNASAIALTVPSGLGLTAGQRIDLAQRGAGQVTVAGSGATVNATPGLKFRAQYSYASLVCISTDVYDLMGDLSA